MNQNTSTNTHCNQNQKMLGLFNNKILQSTDAFIYFSRIPDVMARIIEAKQILQKYQIPVPAWLFGIINKDHLFTSQVPLKLMSFLINIGLYDRLLRCKGVPHFLIGPASIVLVAGKLITFEQKVINIFCKIRTKTTSHVVYQKNPHDDFGAFSLYSHSQNTNTALISEIVHQHKIDRCIIISSHLYNVQLDNLDHSCLVENIIESDPQLSIFWPFLKKHSSQCKKIFSYKILTHFK